MSFLLIVNTSTSLVVAALSEDQAERTGQVSTGRTRTDVTGFAARPEDTRLVRPPSAKDRESGSGGGGGTPRGAAAGGGTATVEEVGVFTAHNPPYQHHRWLFVLQTTANTNEGNQSEGE